MKLNLPLLLVSSIASLTATTAAQSATLAWSVPSNRTPLQAGVLDLGGPAPTVVTVDEQGIVRRWGTSPLYLDTLAEGAGSFGALGASPLGGVVAVGMEAPETRLEFSAPPFVKILNHADLGVAYDLEFDPSGAMLCILAEEALEVRETTTWTPLAKEPGQLGVRLDIGTQYVVSAGNDKAHIRKLPDLGLVRTITTPINIEAVAISDSDQNLALALADGSVQVYDSNSGALLCGLPAIGTTAVRSLEFDAAGATITVGLRNGELVFADWMNCTLAAGTRPHGQAVVSIQRLGATPLLITAGRDGIVYFLDQASGNPLALLVQPRPVLLADVESEAGIFVTSDGLNGVSARVPFGALVLQSMGFPLGSRGTVITPFGRPLDLGLGVELAIAPSATHIAQATPDGELSLWDIVSGGVVASMSSPSPQEQLLSFASDSVLVRVQDGRRVESIAVPSLAPSWTNIFPATTDLVAVASSANGGLVAVSDAEGRTYELSLSSGAIQGQFQRLGDSVDLLRFSPGGAHIFVAYGTGNLELWNLTTDLKEDEWRLGRTSVRDMITLDNPLRAVVALNSGELKIVDVAAGTIVDITGIPDNGPIVGIANYGNGLIVISRTTGTIEGFNVSGL